MEWLGQLAITLLGSLLTYLAATKKSKIELEKVKVQSNNEIEKMKVATQEQIKIKVAEMEINSKSKEENIKFETMAPFLQGMLNDPQKAGETLKRLQELSKMFPPTNNQ